MKPSSEKGVVAVLSTLPECKVVNDYLNSRDYLASLGESSPVFQTEYLNSTADRFRVQTQHLPNVGILFGGLDWNAQPEFNILPQDVEIIKNAAFIVLKGRNPLSNLYNAATGRSKAARVILQTLRASPEQILSSKT